MATYQSSQGMPLNAEVRDSLRPNPIATITANEGRRDFPLVASGAAIHRFRFRTSRDLKAKFDLRATAQAAGSSLK